MLLITLADVFWELNWRVLLRKQIKLYVST